MSAIYTTGAGTKTKIFCCVDEVLYQLIGHLIGQFSSCHGNNDS